MKNLILILLTILPLFAAAPPAEPLSGSKTLMTKTPGVFDINAIPFASTNGWLYMDPVNLTWNYLTKSLLVNGTASISNLVVGSITLTNSLVLPGVSPSKFLATDSGTNVVSRDIAVTDLAFSINATNIANGSVSNTEFQYVDGVTSSIQAQLNALAASGTVGTMINSGASTTNDFAGYNDGTGTNLSPRTLTGTNIVVTRTGSTIALTGNAGTVTGTGTAGVHTKWSTGGTGIEDGYLLEGGNNIAPRTNIVTTLGLSNLFLSINASNYYSAGSIGVQSTAPVTAFHVSSVSTADPRGITDAQYTSDVLGAQLGFRKARGTEASPSILTTGDLLGSLNFSGYDGANYLNMAGIDVGTSGTVASTRVPTWMQFSTATDAAPSVKTPRMFIDKTGVVGIGTTNVPTATFGTGLSIVSSGGSGDPQSLVISKYSSDVTPTETGYRKARGTEASPTVITAGDSLHRTVYQGLNTGGTFSTSARLDVVSAGVGASSVSSQIRWATLGSAGIQTHVVITTNGNLIVSPAGTGTAGTLSSDNAVLELGSAAGYQTNYLALLSNLGKVLFVINSGGTLIDNSGSNITFGVSGISSTTASNITGNGFINSGLGYRVAGAAALGSILAGNGTNFMNTPVGPDGYIMAADSTKTNGINWIVAPTGTTTGSGTTDAMAVWTSSSALGAGPFARSTGTNGTLTGDFAANGITSTNSVNAATGYQVAGAAAKGSLLTGDGTNFKNLAVGADGTLPFADNSQTYGIRWANLTNSSGGSSTGLVGRVAMFDGTAGTLTNVWLQYTNNSFLPDTNNVIHMGNSSFGFLDVTAKNLVLTQPNTGTAPMTVTSRTVVNNLNVEMLSGYTYDKFRPGFIKGEIMTTDVNGDYFRILPNQSTNFAMLISVGTGGSYPNIGNYAQWGQISMGQGVAATQTSTTNFTINVVNLFTLTADATVANTAAETTLLGTAGYGSKTLAANSFTVGRSMHGSVRGRYGSAAVAGTLQIKVKLGSTVILDTGAVTAPNLSTDKTFDIDYDIVCRTTGGTGSVRSQGKVLIGDASGLIPLVLPMVNTSATTIDTTTTQVVDVTATWGTADASNTITTALGSLQ